MEGGTGGKNDITYLVGDTREIVKGIADNSVDLVATSPP
jgi:DNA modification methylase